MKPKNIILFHLDQVRSDCLGCYGNTDVKTKAIDCIAKDGVTYKNHYTVYPVCTPSRYSMLSGMYTHQHCAWTNEATLPNGFNTFPKELSKNGYKTATVGKCHFTPTYQNVGFQKMILSEQNGQGRYEDDYHTYLMENGLIDAIDLTDQVDEHRKKANKKYYDHFGAFESDLNVKYHSTSWVTETAKNEINNWNSDEQNMLMIGYIKPHHPFDPPYPYSKMYNPDNLTLPYGYTADVPDYDYENGHGFFDNKTLSEDKLRQILAYYYATITQIDDGIAEIIKLLKEKGIYDNSLIIVTSDHGEYMGFHHMLLKGNFLYEPLAKIPLIIKYPDNEYSGYINDNLCENIDLATTILSCCNIEKPSNMDGIDLHNQNNGREYAFSEGQYGTQESPCINYMINDGRYKIIINGSLENCMLFDLENDKAELNNLISNPEYKVIAAKLKGYAIDKMLFSGSGKNHCDITSPQMKNQAELDKKSAILKAFIDTKVDEFKKL